MKKSVCIILVVLGWLTGLRAPAQGFAPPALTAQVFDVTVQAGSPPFTTNGQYMLFTSPLGTNFVALGQLATNMGAGTYNYNVTGSNAAAATFLDAQSGQSAALS